MKRCDNDKRVLALYVEYVAYNFDRAPPSYSFFRMKDMMTVLVRRVLRFYFTPHLPDRLNSRLKCVSDTKRITADGQTIEGRMQRLCDAVAGDIRKCGNACDTYLKWVCTGFLFFAS